MKVTARWRRLKSNLLRRPTRSQLVKVELILAPLAVAAVLFFWKFRSVGLSHWDEYYFLGTAAAMNPTAGWGHLYPYDPPLFPLFLFVMFRQFGFQDYVAVATSGLIAFMLCIATLVWVSREYDLRTAIISTSILTTTELFIFYAKMALSDMAFTFFFSLAVFAYFQAIKSQKGWTYILAGVMLTLAIAAKYNGFQPLLIAAIFVLFFHFIRLGTGRGIVTHRMANCVRVILHSLSGLWLSTAPAIIFTVLFLAFLGKPFRINDSGAMLGLARDFIPRVSEGLAYFVRVVYPTKTAVVRIQPFVTANFYSNVLTSFIAAPVLLLALIGAVKGIAKRYLADILLIIWVIFIFVYFASTPATYARVMLPAVVPIAILSGSGLSSILSSLDRFVRTHKFSALRRQEYRTIIKAGLVLCVIAVNLILAAPAITNTHSAYRTAAEFIARNVPDGQLVWLKAQPVLIAYLGIMGKQVKIADDITQINQAYIVVLDFIAQSYAEWPQIQAHISRMQLVFSIKNDVPAVNVLDWTDFARLARITSDESRMSIRIYARAGTTISIQSASVSTFSQTGGFGERVRPLRGTLSSLSYLVSVARFVAG